MPFDRGTLTFTIFEIPEELPENIIDLFASRKAGTLDSVNDEPQIGWVTGHHLLDTSIDAGSAQSGGCYYLALRQAVRKIPGSLLNALCRREEQAYIKANNLEYVSGKLKRQIKEETVEKHINKMPPSLSGIPFVLEPNRRLMYVGATSQAQIDLFVDNFMQTTGIEPVQFTPEYILEKELKRLAIDVPILCLEQGVTLTEAHLGRDFLLFLWYYSESVGELEHPEYGSFDVLIEGPLNFEGDGEDRGAGETVVRKGESPLRSAEAKAALSVGKKLKKAKLSLTRLNQIWSGTFDADKFSFSSFKLPEGEQMNDFEIFAERIENLAIFRDAITAYFLKFAEAMSKENFENTRKAICEWADKRESI